MFNIHAETDVYVSIFEPRLSRSERCWQMLLKLLTVKLHENLFSILTLFHEYERNTVTVTGIPWCFIHPIMTVQAFRSNTVASLNKAWQNIFFMVVCRQCHYTRSANWKCLGITDLECMSLQTLANNMKDMNTAVEAPPNVGDWKFWAVVLNLLYTKVIEYVHTVQTRYHSINIHVIQPRAEFLQTVKNDIEEKVSITVIWNPCSHSWNIL
jgi:hypothetical protein